LSDSSKSIVILLVYLTFYSWC